MHAVAFLSIDLRAWSELRWFTSRCGYRCCAFYSTEFTFCWSRWVASQCGFHWNVDTMTQCAQAPSCFQAFLPTKYCSCPQLGNIVFSFAAFLISSQSPNSCEKLCTDNWLILNVDHEAPNLKKKVRPATHWPAPWPRVSSSPFLSQKKKST